jgi:alkanesulfonate monooxygenase SsuD/methylene tetrahydromethanopterin reductase-like flavin-dependent oxidoreductase (luciferase family)
MDVGTNMFILPLHHPVEVAELFSTLDHLSGGHAVAGFGMGYRDNEFAAFGVPLDERKDRYEESIELVRALWSGETVHHEGRYFRVEGEKISLTPVRPGGPPVWVGAGAHKAGALRAARLGDAWIIPPHVSPERLQTVLAWYGEELDRLGRRSGREVVLRRELVLDHDAGKARERGLQARGELSAAYGAYNAPDKTGTYKHLAGTDAATEVADASYIFGTPETAVERLKELEAAGVTYVVLRMQWYDLPQADVLATMQLFRDEVLPHFP